MTDSGQSQAEPRQVPRAYFLTFTCYGTWLHGDERGSVDRHRRDYDTPGIAPNPALKRFDLGWRGNPEFRLDARGRTVVEAALRETCAAAGWGILAVNVRTNHVHIVVAAALPPERVMTSLKAWSTRRLREEGVAEADTRVWTRHGSTRYLWTEDDMARACTYVTDGQGPDLLRR